MIEKEIKDAMENKKLIIGTKTVLKNLKNNKLKKIIYASNCPEKTKKDLNYYAQFSDIEIKEFKGTSLELGIVCGKPFNILLLGILK